VAPTPRLAVELVVRALARVGVDVTRDVRLPMRGTHVDDATYDALWSAAERRGLRAAHAVEMARHYVVGAVGPGDLAAFSARDVGDALRVLARAWPHMTGRAESLVVRARTGRLWVTFDHAQGEHPIADAFALCAVVDRLRVHAARSIGIERVELMLPQPPDVEPFQRLFGARCTMVWGRERSRFVVAQASTKVPLVTSSEILHARLVALLPRDRTTEIASSIRRWLPRGAHIVDVARSLSTTARSLQRRLAAAGTSYRALRDEVALEHARWLLADPQRSIAEVASSLGFADASTFTRAFTRWTGVPPGRHRAALGTTSSGAPARGGGARGRRRAEGVRARR
jgi:AraC-like DNA-binding protein